MSRMTRDKTAEPVSRYHILRRERGQGSVYFPCSADHEQDWQSYPVDPYLAIRDDHTYCINSGCEKGEAHIDWSMAIPENIAPVTRTTLRSLALYRRTLGYEHYRYALA